MKHIERQRLVDRYVQILDEGHLDELDPILEAAQRDPELSKMIAAVSRGYAEADGRTLSEDEQLEIQHRVRDAVENATHSKCIENKSPTGGSESSDGAPISMPHVEPVSNVSWDNTKPHSDGGDKRAHGHTFMHLLVSEKNMRPSEIAPLLNATEEFIDDINDYSDVGGADVVLRLVTSAHEKLKLDASKEDAQYAMKYNKPRMAMAASRDNSYNHAPPTFEEILDRSGMTEEQKTYWRSVYKGKE